jgi:hypothetical protein
MITVYKIITQQYIPLEDLVNIALKLGWELCGGPSGSPRGNIQAVYKHTKNPEEECKKLNDALDAATKPSREKETKLWNDFVSKSDAMDKKNEERYKNRSFFSKIWD